MQSNKWLSCLSISFLMEISNDCFTLSTKYEFMLILERQMEEKNLQELFTAI